MELTIDTYKKIQKEFEKELVAHQVLNLDLKDLKQIDLAGFNMLVNLKYFSIENNYSLNFKNVNNQDFQNFLTNSNMHFLLDE